MSAPSSAPGISPLGSDANDNDGREDLTAGTAPNPVNGGLEQAGGGESGPQVHARSEAATSTTLLTPLRAHYHKCPFESSLVGAPDTGGPRDRLSQRRRNGGRRRSGQVADPRRRPINALPSVRKAQRDSTSPSRAPSAVTVLRSTAFSARPFPPDQHWRRDRGCRCGWVEAAR
jgi:hypothetical protein